MLVGMKSGSLAYNNGKIYYELRGSGEPVVFMHGFTLDCTTWQPQVAFFGKDYQVITYDARGFGKSSLPKGPYSHTADLRALLGHLGVPRAHIVGLSMGGRNAINFALTNPEMVTSLALLDTALGGYKSEVDWDVHAIEQGIKNAKENWLNHEIFAATRKQPAVVAALRLVVNGYSGWHWLHGDPQEPMEIPALNRLHEIAQPTLVMVGEEDLAYFHNIANVLAAEIPNAQKIVVPNAGHMVNIEAPDRVNQLLAEFIAS